jgi:formiminoglutamate deiminase
MRRLWFDQALLPSGWARHVEVAFEGQSLASITVEALPSPDAERHAIALPGLPNLHSHAFQRAAAGRTGRRGLGGDSFWTWRTEIYRLAQTLTPEAVGAIAGLAYAEMLESGFTHAGEFHYLHHQADGTPYDNPAEIAERLIDAAIDVGIDMTLLPVFYAHSDVGGAAPRPEQARFVSSLDLYADLLAACQTRAARSAGVQVGVAPHSLRAVTPAELTTVTALAKGGPVHIHIAEQRAEVGRCEAVLGARPVAWLLANNDVTARWCLVHATHITGQELSAIVRSGAVVGLCPITEADLGDGLFPAAAFNDAGGFWGVGSDSNVLIDAAAELRWLEYGQRLVNHGRNILATDALSTGRSLFEAARRGGAQALAADGGGLVVGAPATLISLNPDDLALWGRSGDDLLDGWMFAARTGVIDSVWSRGQRVVHEGRHVSRSRLEAAYRRYVQ